MRKIAKIDHYEERRNAFAEYVRGALEAGDEEQAKVILKQVREPWVQNSFENRGWLDLYVEELERQGKKEGSLQKAGLVRRLLEHFLEEGSGSTAGKVRVQLGKLLFAQGELEGVVSALGKCHDQEYQLSDGDKAEVSVMVADATLRLGQYANAEMWANRARGKEARDAMGPALTQQFTRICAELDFALRRFISACIGYYKLDMIDRAIVALALSYADPKVSVPAMANARVRLIGRLLGDERSVLSPLHAILFLLSKDRFLKPEQRALLSKHVDHPAHLQPLPELLGFSVVDQALIEYNISAASNVYDNISFNDLAAILEIPASRIEKVALQMIMENRLVGSIDQVKQILFYSKSKPSAITIYDARLASSFSLLLGASVLITSKYKLK